MNKVLRGLCLIDRKRFFGGRDTGKATAASEHFVLADLLQRGFEVTKPLSPTAKHDLHAKIGGKWYGVQVKCGDFNPNTGRIRSKRGPEKSSPILALVYVPLWKIEYRPGTEPLPEELVNNLEASIQEFEAWQSTSTNAESATAPPSSDESIRPDETSSSAPNAGVN